MAFFLLASVPPSLPRKESSFFLEGGDFGVGDLGEEGDFCGDVAMLGQPPPALRDGAGGSEAPVPWEAVPGSERKRNYFKHLRQLLLRSPGSPAPSLPPPALPPAGEGPLPSLCSRRPRSAPGWGSCSLGGPGWSRGAAPRPLPCSILRPCRGARHIWGCDPG